MGLEHVSKLTDGRPRDEHTASVHKDLEGPWHTFLARNIAALNHRGFLNDFGILLAKGCVGFGIDHALFSEMVQRELPQKIGRKKKFLLTTRAAL